MSLAPTSATTQDQYGLVDIIQNFLTTSNITYVECTLGIISAAFHQLLTNLAKVFLDTASRRELLTVQSLGEPCLSSIDSRH